MFTILSKITKSWMGLQYTWGSYQCWVGIRNCTLPQWVLRRCFWAESFPFCEKYYEKKIPLQIPSFWGKKRKKENFFGQNSSQLTTT
jgi:hypothetical protein